MRDKPRGDWDLLLTSLIDCAHQAYGKEFRGLLRRGAYNRGGSWQMADRSHLGCDGQY